MKKSIIWDIFSGKMHFESINFPKSDHPSWNTATDTYEQLEQKLSPELFDLVKKFEDALDGNFCAELQFYFVAAFKIGLRVGLECAEE